MRTDPTDTGGLFTGRRPGTAPVRYRSTPERGSSRRQHVDDVLAVAVAAVMVVVNLLFWGPIPAGGLWVASRISGDGTDRIFLAIVAAFALCLGGLLGGLVVLKRLDGLWILIRRAAGHDQRTGIIGPIFAVCAVVGGLGFTIWLVFIAGLGSSVMPGHS
jgi:hypothetical protein